jgi:hypothetical protein
MQLLSLNCLLFFISFLTAPAAAAENASICDRTDWVGQLAHKTNLCPPEEPEEPKHHGKGPQCRPGITTCKDREHRCCNDFVCELMCDPEEDDDDHDDGQACGGDEDKDCSCRHTCVEGKCQQKPFFATGVDDGGSCLMIPANNGTLKHVNGTHSIKAPSKPNTSTSIPSMKGPEEHVNGTLAPIMKAPKKSTNGTSITNTKGRGKKGSETAVPVHKGPGVKSKPSAHAHSGTAPSRLPSEDSEPEDFDSRFQKCSGGRIAWPSCESTYTCLDIARFQDEQACGGRCDGPSYCVQ